MITEERFGASYVTFLERRAELGLIREPAAWGAQIKADATLAIGLLIGAGFPGSAAAVSRLLDTSFPDEQWPWAEL